MNKKVIPFNKDEWGFKKKRNKFDSRNEDAYVKWILATLKRVSLGQYGTEELPENHRWNSLCIYMNNKNIEYLHEYLEPMVWMNYSPMEDSSLSDTEFAVDLDNLTEDHSPVTKKE